MEHPDCDHDRSIGRTVTSLVASPDARTHIRGSLAFDAPLAPYSWFRTGGPAEALFEPADEADLAAFLAACPADVPVTVIGLGSNLLVRDGGVEGVVLRLGKGFQDIRIELPLRIRAGPGRPT